MRETGKLAVRIAIALALALLFVPSGFADWRPRDETRTQRVMTEGRIRSIVRDRGGYRIELDRSDYRTFYVPNMEITRAPRRMWVSDLRVGAFVRISGYVGRWGEVNADVVEWAGNGGHVAHGMISGVIRRVDLRNDRLVLRDLRNERTVTVDMSRVDRRQRGIDLDDLHRGDRITVFGEWRYDVFIADRIEGYRSY